MLARGNRLAIGITAECTARCGHIVQLREIGGLHIGRRPARADEVLRLELLIVLREAPRSRRSLPRYSDRVSCSIAMRATGGPDRRHRPRPRPLRGVVEPQLLLVMAGNGFDLRNICLRERIVRIECGAGPGARNRRRKIALCERGIHPDRIGPWLLRSGAVRSRDRRELVGFRVARVVQQMHGIAERLRLAIDRLCRAIHQPFSSSSPPSNDAPGLPLVRTTTVMPLAVR